MGNKEPVEDVGFIAGNPVLETYKTDSQKALLIKEAMCRCVV